MRTKEKTSKKRNGKVEYAMKDINRVELYLIFSTDGDFWVNSDGLKSFIDSRLADDILKFDFRVDKIPLGAWDEKQLIRLSVERPLDIRGMKEDCVPETLCFYHPNIWAEEAIEQVLFPAYMWIFAEIGIGNSHGVSSYFSAKIFQPYFGANVFQPYMWASMPMENWLKSGFTDGVRLSSRCETMSGNYGGSWAQFRFILGDAKDNGDPKPYIDSVVSELEALHNEEE